MLMMWFVSCFFLLFVYSFRSQFSVVGSILFTRGTTGSSILDHDFGHLCFGRRNQISGHSDFGIFNKDGAACPAHPGSLDVMSMTFEAVI